MNDLQFFGRRRNIKKDSYRERGNHPERYSSTHPAHNVTPLTDRSKATSVNQWGRFYLSRNRKVSCFGRSAVERREGNPQAQVRALSPFRRVARCRPRVTDYPSGEHAKPGARRRGKTPSGKGPTEKRDKAPRRMTFATKALTENSELKTLSTKRLVGVKLRVKQRNTSQTKLKSQILSGFLRANGREKKRLAGVVCA